MNTPASRAPKQDTPTGLAPLSVKLSASSRQRLRELAESMRRPAHALAREAIEAYLEQEETRIRRNQEADAAWRHYQDTGLYVDGQEAANWLRSLSSARPLDKPQPRCEK